MLQRVPRALMLQAVRMHCVDRSLGRKRLKNDHVVDVEGRASFSVLITCGPQWGQTFGVSCVTCPTRSQRAGMLSVQCRVWRTNSSYKEQFCELYFCLACNEPGVSCNAVLSLRCAVLCCAMQGC